MALNLNDVYTMTIPVLTQPAATWHELSVDTSQNTALFEAFGPTPTTKPTGSFGKTTNTTGNSPRVRLTFTLNKSASSDVTYEYKVNGSTVSSVSSPLDLQVSSSTVIQITQRDASDSSTYRQILLQSTYNSTLQCRTFKILATSSDQYSARLPGEFSLVVTKLEQYYVDDPTPYIRQADVKMIKDPNNVVLWSSGPKLASITLSGYNTSLEINSTFIYGGTVTAHYSDGTTADVTLDTTFSGYDMSTGGTQTVTASYTDGVRTKTATYQLTVVSTTWHTIWSGSLSNTSNEFASTASGTGTTPRIRVTFSSISASGNSTGYTVNGSSQSTKPTSPITVTLGSANNLVVLSSSGSSQYDSASATLKKVNKSSDHVAFSFEYSHYDPYSMNISSAYLNITKIEQYY